MPSTSEVTLPAARLRVGDGLPAQGVGAVVAQPPIVSTDGSMLSVVVNLGEGNAKPRLVRVPVDQTVTVLRPVATAKKFVRQTRTAQSSGARILVLDLTHPDSEIQPLGKHRYATLCTAHHSLEFHVGVSTADAIASHPEEWCTPCATTSRERARARVYGMQERRPA